MFLDHFLKMVGPDFERVTQLTGLDVGAAGVHDEGRRRLRHRHLGALPLKARNV